MEKETPEEKEPLFDCPDCTGDEWEPLPGMVYKDCSRCGREDAIVVENPSRETPTEEWEGWFRERHSIKATAWREEDVIKARLVERFWNERQLGDMVEDIKSILSSHDAELARKIGAFREEPHKSSEVTFGDTQYNNHAVVYGKNLVVDAVLALLGTKK